MLSLFSAKIISKIRLTTVNNNNLYLHSLLASQLDVTAVKLVRNTMTERNVCLHGF